MISSHSHYNFLICTFALLCLPLIDATSASVDSDFPPQRVSVDSLSVLREHIQMCRYDRIDSSATVNSEILYQRALRAHERNNMIKENYLVKQTLRAYRELTIMGLMEIELPSMQANLEFLKQRMSQLEIEKMDQAYKRLIDSVASFTEKEFDIISFRHNMLTQIRNQLWENNWPFQDYLPKNLFINGFTLQVVEYYDIGSFDFIGLYVDNVSGFALTSFNSDPEQKILVEFSNVRIVPMDPIPGRNMDRLGRITRGDVLYPTTPRYPETLKMIIDTFLIYINSLKIYPNSAVCNLRMIFPPEAALGEKCLPLGISLEDVGINVFGELYAELTELKIPPFRIGDLGMRLVTGKGIIIDFSSNQSYPGIHPLWRGVILLTGAVEGTYMSNELVISNIGFLQTNYKFKDATINAKGFSASLLSTEKFSYSLSNPIGYRIDVLEGIVLISESRITGGELTECLITLPKKAIINGSRTEVVLQANKLIILSDGRIFGQVKTSGIVSWGLFHIDPIRPSYSIYYSLYVDGAKAVFFTSPDVTDMNPTFWPLLQSSSEEVFIQPDLTLERNLPDGWNTEVNSEQEFNSQSQLKINRIQGITFLGCDSAVIHTRDTPGNIALIFPGDSKGTWINVSDAGIHGQLSLLNGRITKKRQAGQGTYGYSVPVTRNLGDTLANYYMADPAFAVDFCYRNDSINYIQFVNSAAFDANFKGLVKINPPWDTDMPFKLMRTTSTSHIVGGQINFDQLMSLPYWGLNVVPRATQGGTTTVISVKTGQIILVGVGLEEKRHFSQPFFISWGDILADGNIRRLEFDYNAAGQTFDGFDYSPSIVQLSPYLPSDEGYLHIGGTAQFDFFGSKYLNILDYKDIRNVNPYNNRRIELGLIADPLFTPTDTVLDQEWAYGLGHFYYKIQYDKANQNGFIGEGKCGLGSLRVPTITSDLTVTTEQLNLKEAALSSSIVMNSSNINMFIHEEDESDFGLDYVGRIAQMSGIYGCACLEDGQLKRIQLSMSLKTSSANFAVDNAEDCSVDLLYTPTISQLTINGKINVNFGYSLVRLDLLGRIRLSMDTQATAIDGDFMGELDFSVLIGHLAAKGEGSFHLGADYMAMQGSGDVSLITPIWGGGVRGGFFIGWNVPKDKAWILSYATEKIDPRNLLPNSVEKLTGVYGYAGFSRSISYWAFSGGFDIAAGLGGFFGMPEKNCPTGVRLATLDQFSLGQLHLSAYGKILGGFAEIKGTTEIALTSPCPYKYVGDLWLEGCVWKLCKTVKVGIEVSEEKTFDLSFDY
jgi:hypothetical protein